MAGVMVLATNALAAEGTMRCARPRAAALLWGVFVGGIAPALVAVADWDGQWLEHVLPLLFVPASAAALALERSVMGRGVPEDDDVTGIGRNGS